MNRDILAGSNAGTARILFFGYSELCPRKSKRKDYEIGRYHRRYAGMHLLAATAGRRVEDDGRQVDRNDSDDPSGGSRPDRQVAAATGSGLPAIRHPKGPCQRRDPNS